MKRLRLSGIVLAILLLAWLAFNLAHTVEPAYQGRTLTDWLRIAVNDETNAPSRLSSSPTQIDAEKAIRQIGTNALPHILELLQTRDSKFKRSANSLLNHQSFIQFRFPDFVDQKLMAVTGIEILGKDATPAVPALIRLTFKGDMETRTCALISLESIRPPKDVFLPVLITLLNNPDKSDRDPEPSLGWRAAGILNNLYPEEAEKAGVYKKFPELKPVEKLPGTNAALFPENPR
jgi:hypothetical protein